eukprot:gene3902-4863_t
MRTDGIVEQIATLGRGASFGDMALFSDQPRSASCYTSVGADLITVDKDTFLRVFQKKAAVLNAESVNFLKKNVQAFTKIELGPIKALTKFLSEVFFPKDHLFNLDTGEKLFFIKAGTCVLLRPCSPEEEGEGPPTIVRSDGTSFIAPTPVTLHSTGFIQLALLTRGSFFGESCCFEELQECWVAQATTNVVLYQISSSKFFENAHSSILMALRDEASFRTLYFAGRRGLRTSVEMEEIAYEEAMYDTPRSRSPSPPRKYFTSTQFHPKSKSEMKNKGSQSNVASRDAHLAASQRKMAAVVNDSIRRLREGQMPHKKEKKGTQEHNLDKTLFSKLLGEGSMESVCSSKADDEFLLLDHLQSLDSQFRTPCTPSL